MKKFRSVSVNIGTLLSFMAILLISVISLCAGIVVYSDYKFNEAALERSEIILANGLLKGSMPLAVATGDIDLIKTIVHDHLAFDEIYAISIRSLNGESLYAEEKSAGSKGNILPKSYKLMSPYENLTMDTFNPGNNVVEKELGSVTIYFSTARLQDEVNKQLYLAIFIILMAIILCSLLILAFNRYFSGKLKQVVSLIETIKTGQRIIDPQESHTIQELVVIDSHLRNMANTIYDRDNELQMTLNNALEAKATAQNAEEFKDYFISAISHDIKTPVGVVVNLLELINEEAIVRISDAALLQKISACYQSAKLLSDITGELFNLEQFQKKELINRCAITSVNDLFDKIASLYEQKCYNQNLLFKVKNANPSHDAIPKNIFIDENKLILMMENIIDNAMKFTNDGLISVSWEIIGQTLRVSIRDSGIGIPEDKLVCIFEKHRQLGDPVKDRHDGRGLGLYYVKQLAEVMKAELIVSSKVGLGTIFEITVPLEKSEYVQSPITSPHAESIRTLIIDDNEPTCFMLTEVLAKMGVESTYECIPELGYNKLIKEAHDLVFIDYHMKNLSGDAIAKRARKILSQNSTIYVCITAEPDAEKLKMLESIFHVVLRKPFARAEIEKIVNFAITSKHVASNIMLKME